MAYDQSLIQNFLRALSEGRQATFENDDLSASDADTIDDAFKQIEDWFQKYQEDPSDERFLVFIEGKLQELIATLPAVETFYTRSGEYAFPGDGKEDNKTKPSKQAQSPQELLAPFVKVQNEYKEETAKLRHKQG